jgi:hypothetical protein
MSFYRRDAEKSSWNPSLKLSLIRYPNPLLQSGITGGWDGFPRKVFISQIVIVKVLNSWELASVFGAISRPRVMQSIDSKRLRMNNIQNKQVATQFHKDATGFARFAS